MKIDEVIHPTVKTIYPLDCLDSLLGLDALRKLHVLIEEHAAFTTIREAKITVINNCPVMITYALTEEEEQLHLRMLKGAHGYWRAGKYHLTYAPRRKRHHY